MTRHNSSCKYYDNTKNGYFPDTHKEKYVILAVDDIKALFVIL